MLAALEQCGPLEVLLTGKRLFASSFLNNVRLFFLGTFSLLIHEKWRQHSQGRKTFHQQSKGRISVVIDKAATEVDSAAVLGVCFFAADEIS